MEEERQKAVLAALPETEREAFVTSLTFEEETAGRLMQREVMAAPAFWTVGQGLEHIRENSADLPELFFDIYVVDPSYKPVGAALPVSLAGAFAARGAAVRRDDRDNGNRRRSGPGRSRLYFREIPPDLGAGRRSRPDAWWAKSRSMISSTSSRKKARRTCWPWPGCRNRGGAPPRSALRGRRFWWLLVNLGTAVLASSVIGLFQDAIAKVVALAVLNPIAASMGGNAGTQTLTVVVRALATRELNTANLLRTVWREIAAGVLNGLAFAVVMAAVTVAVVP